MSTATEEHAPAKERVIIVSPFGIEADHPRNCDLRIKCITNLRLRSAIDGSKPAKDQRNGELRVPRDQAINMGDFPKTPGMQLHVNPFDLSYMVIDPVNSDELMQDRVVKWLRHHKGYRLDKIATDKPVTGKLDIHTMKTLCRELYDIIEAGEAKIIKGSQPTMEEIDQLPGYYLLNPGIVTQTTQPRFEKDFDNWVDRLANHGG